MSVQGSGFKRTWIVKEAQEYIEKKMKRNFGTEEIPVIESLDRIVSHEIISQVNIPGFKRSAMDGFAVYAKDTFGASETSPVSLKLEGSVEIGDLQAPNHVPKTANRISTGAPLPPGADAVVKLEDTEVIGTNRVEIIAGVNTGTNVSKEDEDVKKGQLIFKPGILIKPWDIAMLASIGIEKVSVHKKPKISVLSTGNELVQIGEKPKPGQVIDSNRPAIVAWLSKFPVEIVESSHSNDEPEQLKEVLNHLASTSDLIITTGGTSVGTRDYLPEIIREIGELWIHGISIRPGKPLAVGLIKSKDFDTPIIALPGYPLAAFINFELFVGHILSVWTKQQIPWKTMKTVKLNQKVPSSEGLRDFVRLREGNKGAEVIRITGAGILSSLVTADYMLEVPEDTEGYHDGEEVEVRVLRG